MLLLTLVAFALTPEQQQEDFDTFWSEAEHHPALTLYTSREALEASKAETRARLNVERDPIAFWGVIAPGVSLIGCGHSGLDPTLELVRSVDSRHLFPLDLVVVDDALFLDPRTNAQASRIVSIEDLKADELLTRLRQMSSADGRSTPGPDDRIDRHARILVAAVVGPRPKYRVELEVDGDIRRVETDATQATRPVSGAPVPDKRIRKVPLDDGFVVVAAFESFESMRHTRRTVTRPILRSVKRGARGVILDLRRNGGGAWTAATDLLAHFHPRPFPTYSARLITQSLAERRGLLQGPEALVPREDGLVDMGYGDRAVWQPRSPQVTVPLVVLTAGRTFSTAADVAGFVKRDRMGTVIGGPSGGSARFQTSQTSRDGVLEHSRIGWSIALHRSDLADPEGVLTNGVGAVPDRIVTPTVEDLASGRDPVMEAALTFLDSTAPKPR